MCLSIFLKELTLKDLNSGPTTFDSTGVLSGAGKPAYRSTTRHIRLRFMFVGGLVKDKKNKRHHAPRGKMLADGVTEHLARPSSATLFVKFGIFLGIGVS